MSGKALPFIYMTDVASVGDNVRVLPSTSGQPPPDGVVRGLPAPCCRLADRQARSRVSFQDQER